MEGFAQRAGLACALLHTPRAADGRRKLSSQNGAGVRLTAWSCLVHAFLASLSTSHALTVTPILADVVLIDQVVPLVDFIELPRFLEQTTHWTKKERRQSGKSGYRGYSGPKAPVPGVLVEYFMRHAGDAIRKALPDYAHDVRLGTTVAFTGVMCEAPSARTSSGNNPHIDTDQGLAGVWYIEGNADANIGTGVYEIQSKEKERLGKWECGRLRGPLGVYSGVSSECFKLVAATEFVENRVFLYPRGRYHSSILFPSSPSPSPSPSLPPTGSSAAAGDENAREQKRRASLPWPQPSQGDENEIRTVENLSCNPRKGRLAISFFWGTSNHSSPSWPLNTDEARLHYPRFPVFLEALAASSAMTYLPHRTTDLVYVSDGNQFSIRSDLSKNHKKKGEVLNVVFNTHDPPAGRMYRLKDVYPAKSGVRSVASSYSEVSCFQFCKTMISPEPLPPHGNEVMDTLLEAKEGGSKSWVCRGPYTDDTHHKMSLSLRRCDRRGPSITGEKFCFCTFSDNGNDTDSNKEGSEERPSKRAGKRLARSQGSYKDWKQARQQLLREL